MEEQEFKARETAFGEVIVYTTDGQMTCRFSGPMAKSAASTFIERMDRGEHASPLLLEKWIGDVEE